MRTCKLPNLVSKRLIKRPITAIVLYKHKKHKKSQKADGGNNSNSRVDNSNGDIHDDDDHVYETIGSSNWNIGTK
jgi:hypothetical protein